jgi:CelD/BcsL family acetyltransferase involved in cellulose biosynthesis
MDVQTHREATANSSSLLPLEVFRGANALRDLEPVWNELLADSEANTIFLAWEWADAWSRAYGSRFELCILKLSDASGRPVGIVPLSLVRESIGLRVPGHALYLVGDVEGGAEKLNWIVRRGWEQPVVTATLDWLESPALAWDVLYLNTAPSDSGIVATVLAESKSRNWFLLRGERPSYRATVSTSWDVYLASLSKSTREVIRQRVRRASKNYTVEVRRCESPEQLEGDLQALFRLHTKRWSTRGPGASMFDAQKQSFYRDLAHRCLTKGWLEFWVLSFNGNPVALEFGFCYDGIYSFLKGAFDPEFAPQGVAGVVRAYVMQSLIERKFRIYDFLLGDEEYKESWGGQLYPLLDLSFARPNSKGHRVLAARNHVLRTINWLRTRTPKPVWAFATRTARSLTGRK